jgi:predicted deacylase
MIRAEMSSGTCMRTHRHLLTPPVPGTTRELVSLHYGPANAGRKATIQAALHADEPPGLLVAFHLRGLLAELESAGRLRGEVVLVPMANPLGLSQRLLGRGLGRFELASGENFNRLYADLSHAAFARLQDSLDGAELPGVAAVRGALLAAVEALPADSELAGLRRVLLGLAIDADHVIDLHCDNEAVMHLYTTPPLWPTIEPLARLLGAEVCLLAEDSGGEPFDESCSMVWPRLNALLRQHGRDAAWPLACAAVTVELRGETDVRHDYALADARAIVDYLRTQGYVDGDVPVLPALKREPRPLQGSMPILTPVGGVLVHSVPVGREVRSGELIAEVIDPLSGAVVRLTSPVDGLLYARESGRVVHAGLRVAKVAGLEALRRGPLLSA